MGKIKKQKSRIFSTDARGAGGNEEPVLTGAHSFTREDPSLHKTKGTGNRMPVLNRKDHPTKIVRKHLRLCNGLERMKKKYKHHLRHRLFMSEMKSAVGKCSPRKTQRNFQKHEKAILECKDDSKSPPIISHSSLKAVDDSTSPLLASPNIHSVGISVKKTSVKNGPNTGKPKSRKRRKSMLNMQNSEHIKEHGETTTEDMEDSSSVSLGGPSVFVPKCFGEKVDIRNKSRRGGIPKSWKRQKSLLQDLAAFRSVLNDPSYQSDPAGSISSLIQSRMLQEEK